MKKVISLGMTIFLIFVILLFSSGCGKKAKYECGFRYTDREDGLARMGLRSNTDTFNIDNVSLDLYCGLYDEEFCQGSAEHAKGMYFRDYENLFVIIYIFSGWENPLDVFNFDDYNQIENICIIKEISEEEAFSSEYAYSIKRFKGVVYKHKETITIPQEMFVEDEDCFTIAMKILDYSSQDEKFYVHGRSCWLPIKYTMQEDEKIKIDLDFYYHF